MRRIASIVLIIVILYIFTGCQKTPESAIVVSKNDGMIEKALAKEKTNEQYLSTTGKMTMEIETGSSAVTISVDAPIVVPETSIYPVYGTEYQDISQENLERVVAYFFQDTPLQAEPRRMTQSQVIEEIGIAQASLKELQGEDLKRVKEYIAVLKTELQSAPKDVELEYIPIELSVPQDGITNFRGYADLGGTELGYIEMMNFPEANVSLCTVNTKPELFLMVDSQKNQQEELAKYSLQETEEIAKETLKQIGIEGMGVSSVQVGNTADQSKSGLIVKMMQDIDGVMVSDANILTSTDLAEEETIIGSGFQEITLSVIDNEVVGFEWLNNRKITKLINENVELKPFEDIEKIIEQQLKNILTFSKLESDSKYAYQIDEIKLEYANVKEKNKKGSYLLIPVWNCYGELIESTANRERIKTMDRKDNWSLLCLNAIDGSVLQ